VLLDIGVQAWELNLRSEPLRGFGYRLAEAGRRRDEPDDGGQDHGDDDDADDDPFAGLIAETLHRVEPNPIATPDHSGRSCAERRSTASRVVRSLSDGGVDRRRREALVVTTGRESRLIDEQGAQSLSRGQSNVLVGSSTSNRHSSGIRHGRSLFHHCLDRCRTSGLAGHHRCQRGHLDRGLARCLLRFWSWSCTKPVTCSAFTTDCIASCCHTSCSASSVELTVRC
jgi:hypothetical protein